MYPVQSHSERSTPSPLLTAFLARATASPLVAPPCQQALSSWHLPHTFSFSYQPYWPTPLPCQQQARQPRAETLGTWADPCEPSHGHHKHGTKQSCMFFARCKLQGMTCQHLCCPAIETYPRDPTLLFTSHTSLTSLPHYICVRSHSCASEKMTALHVFLPAPRRPGHLTMDT